MNINNNSFAVIFDMDGVIVNNNKYHKKAWKEFCLRHKFSLTDDEFKKYIYGRINKDILNFLYKRPLTSDETEMFSQEKEDIYREIYKPVIKLSDGLLNLLVELKPNGVKTAVATSAPKSNIEFVFDNTGIRDFFEIVIDESSINSGKPDPEIYLKASDLLNIVPGNCIVFEDSVSGINSAKKAGMKVIAITTTHSVSELRAADLTINSFVEVDVKKLLEIYKQ